jgi:hypothetical protein
MNPRAFIDHMTALLDEQAVTYARENGSSRDRTIDQYRYISGEVSGLRKAAQMLRDEYKRLLSDDDE